MVCRTASSTRRTAFSPAAGSADRGGGGEGLSAAERWRRRRAELKREEEDRARDQKAAIRDRLRTLAAEERREGQRIAADRRRENRERRRAQQRVDEEGARYRAQRVEEQRCAASFADVARRAEARFAAELERRRREPPGGALAPPGLDALPPDVAARERRRLFTATCSRFDCAQEWEAGREAHLYEAHRQAAEGQAQQQRRAALVAAGRVGSVGPPSLAAAGAPRVPRRQAEAEALHQRRVECELTYLQQYATSDTLDALVAHRRKLRDERRRRRAAESREQRAEQWEEVS